jgi:hypothetical protein
MADAVIEALMSYQKLTTQCVVYRQPGGCRHRLLGLQARRAVIQPLEADTLSCAAASGARGSHTGTNLAFRSQ